MRQMRLARNRATLAYAWLSRGPPFERRQTVFGRTMQGFPFSLKTSHALKIREQHVITVTGKGFFDVAHAPGNHSNRRTTPKEYTVWEIHPVMALHVDQ